MYSPVLHVGSRMWMLGKIENHSARPLDEDEIDDLCKKLNARQEGNKEAQHSGGVAGGQGTTNKQRDAIVLAIDACRDAHAIFIDSSEIEYIADAVYAVVAQQHPIYPHGLKNIGGKMRHVPLSEIWQYVELAYDEPKHLTEAIQFVSGHNRLDYFFIAEMPDYYICAFRGTDSEDGLTREVIMRWCRNLSAEPLCDDGPWGKGTIHRGAYQAWAGIKDIFLEALAGVLRRGKIKPVVIAGHSLGAWLAVLAMRHIHKNSLFDKHHQSTCVFFGMPNLFTLQGWMQYYRYCTNRTIGILNGYDIADTFPCSLYKPKINHHLRQPIWHRFIGKIADHLPRNYRKAIKKSKIMVIL